MWGVYRDNGKHDECYDSCRCIWNTSQKPNRIVSVLLWAKGMVPKLLKIMFSRPEVRYKSTQMFHITSIGRVHPDAQTIAYGDSG